jgi:hypothetical protein
MKNIVLLSTVGFFLITSCSTVEKTTVIDETAHRYASIAQKDTRGRNSFPMRWDVHGKKLFVFDPKLAAWAAYDQDGNRVMTGSASGGMDFCKDTNKSCRTVTGIFHVVDKKGADCKSNEFPCAHDGKASGGAKMPYCMHFHRGYAIHAAYEVPTYNTSHGCIHILPDAARWLNQHFIDVGTTVLVQPYA